MISTQIIEDGKEKTVTIASLIEKHNGFIYKISSNWLSNFRYDHSITIEDLAQELKEKFLKDLYKYDCTVGTDIIPYMAAIAKNYFITKKKKVILNHLHPTNGDGTLGVPVSLYTKISNEDDANLTLVETLKTNSESQDNEIHYKDLIRKIKRKLNDVNYAPNSFTKRLRSFTRIVFDTLLDQNEEFTKFILFDHRCCVRASLKNERAIPRTVLIKASAMGRYFGVNKRTINLSYSIIRKIMEKEINKKVT